MMATLVTSGSIDVLGNNYQFTFVKALSSCIGSDVGSSYHFKLLKTFNGALAVMLALQVGVRHCHRNSVREPLIVASAWQQQQRNWILIRGSAKNVCCTCCHVQVIRMFLRCHRCRPNVTIN